MQAYQINGLQDFEELCGVQQQSAAGSTVIAVPRMLPQYRPAEFIVMKICGAYDTIASVFQQIVCGPELH